MMGQNQNKRKLIKPVVLHSSHAKLPDLVSPQVTQCTEKHIKWKWEGEDINDVTQEGVDSLGIIWVKS